MALKLHKTLKAKLAEWNRVLKITRKPDREEFTMSAKVTGAGIIFLGIIGYLIYAGATLIEIAMRGAL